MKCVIAIFVLLAISASSFKLGGLGRRMKASSLLMQSSDELPSSPRDSFREGLGGVAKGAGFAAAISGATVLGALPVLRRVTRGGIRWRFL